MPSLFFSPRRTPMVGALAAMAMALVLSGCGTRSSSTRINYEPEAFGSTTTHSRTYMATEAQTCEAARRALLSQGYLVTAANPDLVTGRKSFQPANEVHVEVEFRVVCAKEVAEKGRRSSTIAFVSALQDRYSLKKTNNSASVGVGAFGSLSVPFSASDDALVKVASETLTDEQFYDRFFALIDRFLAPMEDEPAAAEPAVSAPPAPATTFPVQSSPNRG